MTREEFLALPDLASWFPLVHANGARWTSMTGACSSCQGRFPGGMLRGTVSSFGGGPVFVIEGLGLCGGCDRLTPVRYRVYDDMSMVGPSPLTGEWSRWASRPSLLSRLRRWIRSLL